LKNSFQIYYLFRDTSERRFFLNTDRLRDEKNRTLFYGLDTYQELGIKIKHNLNNNYVIPSWLEIVSTLCTRFLHYIGAYGGNFAPILNGLRDIKKSDLIISTNDSLGIPLALLKALRIIRKPIVYISIGLPHRMLQLKGPISKLYRNAFKKIDSIIAFSYEEVGWINKWLNYSLKRPKIYFIPFGVDTGCFKMSRNREKKYDILSIGADPKRDFQILFQFARRHPEKKIKLITNRDHIKSLNPFPRNLECEIDVPFSKIREEFASAHIIALPVKENEYSGATTTLLQAMAMGRPTVVSAVSAICKGYGLIDGINCRLVKPGYPEKFEKALLQLLKDPESAEKMGQEGRKHVTTHLSWDLFEKSLLHIIQRTARNEKRTIFKN